MKFIILLSIYMVLNYLVCWFFLQCDNTFLVRADEKTNTLNELLRQIPKEVRVWEIIILLLFPLFLIILILSTIVAYILNLIYVIGEAIVGSKARIRYKKAIGKVVSILNKQPFSGKKTIKKLIDK